MGSTATAKIVALPMVDKQTDPEPAFVEAKAFPVEVPADASAPVTAEIPLPEPELYERPRAGDAPRAGENGSGIENEAVPLTAFTANFSSMPLIAPPPFGSESEGI